MQNPAPVLVFGYGNPSRGDDALAPLLIDALRQKLKQIETPHPLRFLTDFQMQIEHVTDMQGCARVLLIDAHADLGGRFQFSSVRAINDTPYTTHGMSPGRLLDVYQKMFLTDPPPTSILAIAGECFDLGQGLSPQARINLEHALSFSEALLSRDFAYWEQQLNDPLPNPPDRNKL